MSYFALHEALLEHGWSGLNQGYSSKGDWSIDFDTSSWFMISTKRHEYLKGMDPPRSNDDRAAHRMVHLIEHLCRVDDEIFRLRDALTEIQAISTAEEARTMAQAALSQCYHHWHCFRTETGQRFEKCAICEQTRTSAGD